MIPQPYRNTLTHMHVLIRTVCDRLRTSARLADVYDGYENAIENLHSIPYTFTPNHTRQHTHIIYTTHFFFHFFIAKRVCPLKLAAHHTDLDSYSYRGASVKSPQPSHHKLIPPYQFRSINRGVRACARRVDVLC